MKKNRRTAIIFNTFGMNMKEHKAIEFNKLKYYLITRDKDTTQRVTVFYKEPIYAHFKDQPKTAKWYQMNIPQQFITCTINK